MLNCYVVYKGKVPGVYNKLCHCQALVTGYNDNSYETFETRDEAQNEYVMSLGGQKMSNHKVGSYEAVRLGLVG
jgi:viroplasmin and RNaseH domain-containing protein